MAISGENNPAGFASATPIDAEGIDTNEWELRLGAQFRSLRLEAGLDQVTLAGLADVSVSSLKSLENGKGSSLRTVIKILRALGATQWLTTLAPEPTVSPLDVLRHSTPTPRRRVYRPRSES